MFVKNYSADDEFFHGKKEAVGVLLVNLGTPKMSDKSSVRRYLSEFLSDARVVEIPRFIWLPLLHGVILRKRVPISAKAYQSVWMEKGSPLMVYSQRLADKLGKQLQQRYAGPVKLALAMRYGEPSIAQALAELRQEGARRIVVLPLYPQYSATTTATVYDAVAKVLSRWRWIPEMRFINQYHDHQYYIRALTSSVKRYWQQHQQGFLLLSFHGLPQRNVQLGDPYFCQCHKTARLLAKSLGLKEDQWKISFQSRFGKAQWVQPYTNATLQELVEQGEQRIDVLCPGFPADCLETLEEMNVENRAVFMEAGGEEYHYIPALNDQADHVIALSEILSEHMQGWSETSTHWNAKKVERDALVSKERALSHGAKI
ncbi:MAG: ferrochelatase [Thiotrichaceae bacterium]|nr:ferrochelatase [Thiotrichaceae bacterium]